MKKSLENLAVSEGFKPKVQVNSELLTLPSPTRLSGTEFFRYDSNS